MELWDAYDTNLNKIKDKTLVRGEAILLFCTLNDASFFTLNKAIVA